MKLFAPLSLLPHKAKMGIYNLSSVRKPPIKYSQIRLAANTEYYQGIRCHYWAVACITLILP